MTNRSTIAAIQCPLCRRPIPREPTEDGGIACGACRMTVLAKHTTLPGTEDGVEDPFPPPPQDWPATITVTEILPSGERRERWAAGATPYRSPPMLPGVPGLLIAWTEDRFWVRLALGVWTVLWSAAVVVGWALLPYHPMLWALSAVPILSLWLTRLMWNGDGFVRADDEGMCWQEARVTGRRVRRLSVDDIAQLFVRNTTAQMEGEGIAFPSFTVCARDRTGRDHELAAFESPRQARWLERRLEHHLGIVDRPIAGELPRSGA